MNEEKPYDPKEELFTKGAEILSLATGLPLARCYPIIGRWLKKTTPEILLPLIKQSSSKSSPIPYVTRALSPEKDPPPPVEKPQSPILSTISGNHDHPLYYKRPGYGVDWW